MTISSHPVEIIDRLKAIVGVQNYIEDTSNMESYLNDARGLFHGLSPLILKPLNSEMVSAIVTLCNEACIGIVPQGGNTGLVGGSVPSKSGLEVVVSLERMNKIIDIDPINYTMTLEAGCILSEVQNAARDVGRMFPLSLAAEGSCQIGGNLSTNAGGTAVLRYGNAKELVLGLEVVLPDGTIMNGLRRLRKDNTGYDLKQLFPNIKTSIGTATEHSIFSVPGFKGKVAVIPSYSRDLCSACNRVRLTADGKIRNCLFAKNEYNVKELLMNESTDNDIADLLLKAMWKKPIDGWKAQRSGKEHRESMTQIGG